MWRATAFCPVLLCVVAVSAEAGAQSGDFYICAQPSEANAAPVGVTLCDATATDMLNGRAEVDNLQVREGALVVDLAAAGVSEIAGLQPGDVIYRVGGVDVTDAQEAATTLSAIGSDSDTVVNFLRRGRPYRVKMRRN